MMMTTYSDEREKVTAMRPLTALPLRTSLGTVRDLAGFDLLVIEALQGRAAKQYAAALRADPVIPIAVTVLARLVEDLTEEIAHLRVQLNSVLKT
jgi:hypothetical protein